MMTKMRALLNAMMICSICGAKWDNVADDTKSAQLSSLGTSSDPNYWVPTRPPKVLYTIECQVDLEAKRIKGIQSIRLTNNASQPFFRLALDWSPSYGKAEIKFKGKSVKILSSYHPMLFELPKPINPGEEAELSIDFDRILEIYEPDKIILTEWHPRLWWGFETHDKFDVKVKIPSGYILATSGRLNPETGCYHADGVRNFGLVLGKNLHVEEARAGDVLVQCFFTHEGAKCARLLLDTAVDVINFYREWLGFYPYKSLCVIPGVGMPIGGYPVATGIVAIHGMEKMEDVPEIHWRWIIAHEIGHQYWGEYVMEKDSPGWLWIGLGIYADREYIRARGLSLEKHKGLILRYIEGVRKGFDTTIARPPEQLKNIDFDFNNVVIHGKGFSVISALACMLGKERFERIYRRCLEEFGGHRMGAAEFQKVCEEESGQDLSWFFNQWVHSNRFLSYQITSRKCSKHNDYYVSEVQVECLGSLKMPIPVVAYFQDGSSQTKFTDRLMDVNILRFESGSPLREVQVDPQEELALAVPPPSAESGKEMRLREEVERMPYVGAGNWALELFKEAKRIESKNCDIWIKLGLTLYGGGYYAEALEAFRNASNLVEKTSIWYWGSLVWQGHILDLQGKRGEALKCYKEALATYSGDEIQHAQYNMVIDLKWIKERLRKPFRRKP